MHGYPGPWTKPHTNGLPHSLPSPKPYTVCTTRADLPEMGLNPLELSLSRGRAIRGTPGVEGLGFTVGVWSLEINDEPQQGVDGQVHDAQAFPEQLDRRCLQPLGYHPGYLLKLKGLREVPGYLLKLQCLPEVPRKCFVSLLSVGLRTS